MHFIFKASQLCGAFSRNKYRKSLSNNPISIANNIVQYAQKAIDNIVVFAKISM